MDSVPSTTDERSASAATAAPAPSKPVAEIPCATLVYLTPIGEFIHSADGKSATILAVLGLMFTLLARFAAWLEMMFRVGNRLEMVVTAILVGLFAAASLAAVVQAFRTISPRFPKTQSSLAFFGDIGKLPPEKYLSSAASLGVEQALAERLKYNHTGARIILLKMQQLWWMFRWFEVAAVCWIALAILLGWKVFSA